MVEAERMTTGYSIGAFVQLRSADSRSRDECERVRRAKRSQKTNH